MRPERENIAAPDLPAGIPWIGEEPASMPILTAGGPALVHFLDFAQLNSVRTLPYLVEWDRRYRDAGLRTIGVQAPRFPFGADPEAVAARARAPRGRVPGRDRRPGADLWHSYGCEGWPSLFLWSLGGALELVPLRRGGIRRRPRRRSRPSCASRTRCARTCRSRWRRCARPTRPAPG